jgi:hypothetical protein
MARPWDVTPNPALQPPAAWLGLAWLGLAWVKVKVKGGEVSLALP